MRQAGQLFINYLREIWARWHQFQYDTRQTVRAWWTGPRQLAVAFSLFGLMGMVINVDAPDPFWVKLYGMVSPELFGIGITVLIIDTAYEIRQRQQLKTQLIRELGSGDNGTAVRAADELRAQGWLTDGSLRYAQLKKADLQGARLQGAQLPHAYLDEANLANADLSAANLERASLNHANLVGATLEKANLNRTFLNSAQLESANLQQAQLTNTQAIAANFSKANLAGVDLRDAFLRMADFKDATFRNITLRVKARHEAHIKFYPVAQNWYYGDIAADLTRANLGDAKNLTIKQFVDIKSLTEAVLPDDTEFENWQYKHLIYTLRAFVTEIRVRWWRMNQSANNMQDKLILDQDEARIWEVYQTVSKWDFMALVQEEE